MSLANKIFRTKKIQKNQKKEKKKKNFSCSSGMHLQSHIKRLLSNFNPRRRRWLYHSLASQQYVHFVRNPTLEKKMKKAK